MGACRCLQRHGNAFGQGHLGTGVGAGVGGGVGLPESVSGHGAVSTSFKNTFFYNLFHRSLACLKKQIGSPQFAELL